MSFVQARHRTMVQIGLDTAMVFLFSTVINDLVEHWPILQFKPDLFKKNVMQGHKGQIPTNLEEIEEHECTSNLLKVTQWALLRRDRQKILDFRIFDLRQCLPDFLGVCLSGLVLIPPFRPQEVANQTADCLRSVHTGK